MLSIVGILIVIGAVFGGYLMHGGTMAVLMQPSEFLIIWGAALGTLVIATPMPVITRILKNFGRVLKGNPYNRAFRDKPLGYRGCLSALVRSS